MDGAERVKAWLTAGLFQTMVMQAAFARAALAKTGFIMNDTTAIDAWESGEFYERYIGRWSRRIAPSFLSWLRIPSGRQWLDVGCGTGALGSAIHDHCAPVWLAGVEPSAGFCSVARRNLAGRALVEAGDAAALPLTDSSVDVTVSGLVLNFVPDAHAALREWMRVTRNGGTIAAYVWDYAGCMEMLRHFWNAAIELDRPAARLDEGTRFPICNPDALAALFTGAGLPHADITSIDIVTSFASFDDYWMPFLGGQGPAPTYVMTLRESARERLRARLQDSLPVRPDGSIKLLARAWAVKAINAK